MLLSEIIKVMKCDEDIDIINEKEVKYLALTASDIKEPTCIFIDSSKYIDDIKSNVKMIITTQDFVPILKNRDFGIIVSNAPRELFFRIHNFMAEHIYNKQVKKNTIIGKNCNISNMSSIAEHNVIIGNNVTIEEFVVIRENTKIDDNSIIRSGCIIGGQGYEFKRIDNGILSVAHSGGVVIGENVEIQYNSCIDRAVYRWDNTVIGDNCKIDNLVHIAHGVKIGKNTLVVANVGIGGRTIIGENAWLGVGATITNGITIGNNARANIGSVVTKSIPNEGNFSGNFAIPHSIFMKNLKDSLK